MSTLVPVRSRICLACRTLLFEHEECAGGGAHRSVSLRELEGRKRLEDEVWGPDSRARKARNAARAGAGGVGLGGLFEGCTGCDAFLEGFGGGEAALLVAVALLAVLLFQLARSFVRWLRKKLDRPKPHGALLRAPTSSSRRSSARGVIRRGTPMALPWAAGSAFAYAMELRRTHVFGGGAMLRDAVTAGFEVALDDGRVLRVPPGRVQLMGALPVVRGESTRIAGLLGRVGLGVRDGEHPLVPYDHVRGRALGPGDHVEIYGELMQNGESDGGGYRSPSNIVVPVGPVVLRPRSSASIDSEAPMHDEGLHDEHDDEDLHDDERRDPTARS